MFSKTSPLNFMALTHSEDVQAIQRCLLEANHKKEPITLNKQNASSHSTRSPTYKKSRSQINIGNLNRILSIDPQKRIAVVEPRVTMVQLAKATLKYGLTAPVVPEFKDITVGGAIMGTAIESTSHHFGLFSDSCLSYEVLLGDGSIVRASPKENVDLFYGLVGSYGSLGIILSAEVQLISAPSHIKLTYRRFSSLTKALSHLAHIKTAPPFIEGFLFAPDNIIVVEGSPLDENNSSPELSLDAPWSPWFYQHVKGTSRNEEKITFFDYLFRHDRGAYWMGAFATHPALYSGWLLKKPFHKLPKDPGALFRFILGWALTSKRLYSVLHAKAEDWASEQFIIQDYFIPFSGAETFIEKVISETKIAPLWLCPVSTTNKQQIFSPHLQKSSAVLDIGIYGVPEQGRPCDIIQKLDRWAQDHEARKMLYAYSYYSKDQFWEIYPRKRYEELRHRYHADAWLGIDQKIAH